MTLVIVQIETYKRLLTKLVKRILKPELERLGYFKLSSHSINDYHKLYTGKKQKKALCITWILHLSIMIFLLKHSWTFVLYACIDILAMLLQYPKYPNRTISDYFNNLHLTVLFDAFQHIKHITWIQCVCLHSNELHRENAIHCQEPVMEVMDQIND